MCTHIPSFLSLLTLVFWLPVSMVMQTSEGDEEYLLNLHIVVH